MNRIPMWRQRQIREQEAQDEATRAAAIGPMLDPGGCANCGADEVVMVDDSDPSVGYHDTIPWCVKGNHRAD